MELLADNPLKLPIFSPRVEQSIKSYNLKESGQIKLFAEQAKRLGLKKILTKLSRKKQGKIF